jgi:UDP-N-acetylglucosamine 2-epimerase
MVDSQDVDNQESLEVLVRAISFSLGELSLILVRCNYAHLREQFVQRLREQCPIKIRELVLDESIKTLYTTIKTALQDEKPDALMVLGLELVNDIDTRDCGDESSAGGVSQKFPVSDRFMG